MSATSGAPAPPGSMHIFLTPRDIFFLSKWQADESEGHPWLVAWLPENLAPSLLALAGPILLGSCWYMLQFGGRDLKPWISVAALAISLLLSKLCRLHANAIRQRSVVGDLFQTTCTSLAAMFGTLVVVHHLDDGTSMEFQWYLVQVSTLIVYQKQVAIASGKGIAWIDQLGSVIVLIAASILLGGTLYGKDNLASYWKGGLNYQPVDVLRSFYYLFCGGFVLRTWLLGNDRMGLVAALLLRILPAILYHTETQTLEMGGVLCDGVAVSILSTEVFLARVAGRHVHPFVVLFSLAAVVGNPSVLLLVSIGYYLVLFGELSYSLHTPLFTVCRNVYCDGIYDLCHVGHKNLFQNALKLGDQLFVGVIGDKDALQYKRPPIMSGAERCAEVQACKGVTKVIPDAPCWGLTKEFLDKHRIHVVGFGEEYQERYPDPKDDPYYRVPRELGIARPLPRTKGLSTSDLIRRIQAAAPADLKKSPT